MGTLSGYTGRQLTSGCAWPNICFSLMFHHRLGNLSLTSEALLKPPPGVGRVGEAGWSLSGTVSPRLPLPHGGFQEGSQQGFGGGSQGDAIMGTTNPASSAGFGRSCRAHPLTVLTGLLLLPTRTLRQTCFSRSAQTRPAPPRPSTCSGAAPLSWTLEPGLLHSYMSKELVRMMMAATRVPLFRIHGGFSSPSG